MVNGAETLIFSRLLTFSGNLIFRYHFCQAKKEFPTPRDPPPPPPPPGPPPGSPLGGQQGGFAPIYVMTRKRSECGESENESELSHADRSADFSLSF